MEAKRFPLPKTSRAADTFRKLSVAVPIAELPALRHQLTIAFSEFKRFENSLIGPSITQAAEIVKRCQFMLDSYANRNKHEQALIVGALKYFITKADAIPDDRPVVGLDDDARIVNHVLEELRVHDRFIE
jgi:uncharacterized membrane protein YkvA (DUF1232 family)